MPFTDEEKLVSIDFETYEQDHSYVLEVGVSVCRSRDIPVTTYHFIIEENEYLCNGRYVSDHRNWFMYGRSIRCSFKEAMQKVAEELKDAQYLVGHDLRGELEVLQSAGIELGSVRRLDSQRLFKSLYPREVKTNLGAIASVLQVAHEGRLHNAANDAYVTLLAVLKMTSLHKS